MNVDKLVLDSYALIADLPDRLQFSTFISPSKVEANVVAKRAFCGWLHLPSSEVWPQAI